MESFKNKNILFLSAAFFNYEKMILQRLEERGASVDYFNERPSNSLLTKGIIRVHRNFYKLKIKRYYQKILKFSAVKKYDFLLIIKGETVPDFFLKSFRKTQPQAKLIFYSYDPVSEYPAVLKVLPFFSKIISFDRADARQYKMYFRPLFYNAMYASPVLTSASKKWDISFVGSAHTDRFLVGEQVALLAKKLKLRTFFYYYAPAEAVLLLKRILDPDLKKIDLKKVRYEQLNHQEIADLYQRSKAVLDIQKPFQNGLTMRTFEVLASGTKLITTNKDVLHFPFYNANNIVVIDRENPVLEPSFFETPFQPLSEEEKFQMSLDCWLEDVFLKEQNAYWKI